MTNSNDGKNNRHDKSEDEEKEKQKDDDTKKQQGGQRRQGTKMKQRITIKNNHDKQDIEER